MTRPVSAAKKEPALLSTKYPHYHKDVTMYETVDVYRVMDLFNIQDPSGRLQHAGKKILVSGARGGGKGKYKDIKEAHATLGSWLEDNKHLDIPEVPSVDGITLTDEELTLLRKAREKRRNK